MQQFLQDLVSGWPPLTDALHISFRLLLAAIVGAVPGMQREHIHTAAGLRTHILVALGSALFVLAALDMDASADATTRVLQGIATGIGFVGAGTILRPDNQSQVRGLTTAASIWLTAGLGSAAGAGRIWLALFAAVLALPILSILRKLEPAHQGPSPPS